MTAPRLTDVQRRCMSVIYWRIMLRREPPVLREIADAIGWSGIGRGVHAAVGALESMGLITRLHRRRRTQHRSLPRTIRLTELGRAWCPLVEIDLGTARAIPKLGWHNGSSET